MARQRKFSAIRSRREKDHQGDLVKVATFSSWRVSGSGVVSSISLIVRLFLRRSSWAFRMAAVASASWLLVERARSFWIFSISLVCVMMPPVIFIIKNLA